MYEFYRITSLVHYEKGLSVWQAGGCWQMSISIWLSHLISTIPLMLVMVLFFYSDITLWSGSYIKNSCKSEKKDADELVKAAFPEEQKVRGVGSQDAQGIRKKNKME